MIRKSILMSGNTGTEWSHIGKPIPANAYLGYTDGVATVQVVVQNFVGGFGIQGTLSLNPQPEDWFWIKLNNNGDNTYPYITYPRDPLVPTGQNGGDTGSEAFTFVGNFVYLRTVMTREYILPPESGIPTAWSTWIWGQVDKTMLSL